MKAIIYARFSPRRNSDKCESVETQTEICRKYCLDHKIEVAGEYHDKALSGADEDRPGLWDAVDQLKKGDILLVYRLDRLARSVYLSHYIERAVGKKRASIRSVAGQGTDGTAPEDVLIKQILQAVDEHTAKVTAVRTRQAMLRHQKNGRRMSHRLPYGWKQDPDKPARMIPDEAEQAAIRIIATLGGTMPLRAIAAELEKQNVSPRPLEVKFKGQKLLLPGKWSHVTIFQILKRLKEK